MWFFLSLRCCKAALWMSESEYEMTGKRKLGVPSRLRNDFRVTVRTLFLAILPISSPNTVVGLSKARFFLLSNHCAPGEIEPMLYLTPSRLFLA